MRYQLFKGKQSSATPLTMPDGKIDLFALNVASLMQIYVTESALYTVDRGQTSRTKMKAVCRIIGHLPIADVVQGTIDLFSRLRTEEGKSPHTVRSEAALLKSALRYAADHGWRPPVPTLRMPRVRNLPKRVLTPDEAHRLLRATQDVDCFRFIAIGLATGARMGAIMDLSWERVRLRERLIDFRAPAFRADRKKHRAVVAVTAELLSLLGAKDDLSGPVITISKQSIARRIRLAAESAGLGNDVTAHTLRRTAATTIVKTLPIEHARRMLGHSYIQTTDAYYVKLSPHDLLDTAKGGSKMINELENLDLESLNVQKPRPHMIFHILDEETDSMLYYISKAKGLSTSVLLKELIKNNYDLLLDDS